MFNNELLTEWDLSKKRFDVILGKPWFEKYNPHIDWRTNKIIKVDEHPAESAWMIKVNVIESKPQVIPDNIQKLLKEFEDVFPNELPNELPPKRAINFEVIPKPDAKPSARAPFRLSQVERNALDQFVEDLKKKGWVELSNSPWASSIFSVPKKNLDGTRQTRAEWLKTVTADTKLRWVLDYRHVNQMSEIPKIPLPNIEDLFDQMTGSKIFTTIDLASGYHQMLVVPESKKYTAFRTHKELLQWVVAPMGMAGMPGTWSRLMRLLFDNCKNVVVYMDDLCIFSKSMIEHEADLRRVFEILRTNTLYARKIKCEFAKKSVKFLGHEISGEGLLVDSTKVRAIEERKPPTNRKELLSFLGLCGYYRKFISNYAHMVLPMSNLVKEDSVWEWKEPQQRAFTQLKVALQQAPVLQLPDYTQPFRVTTDASGYCCGAVLSKMELKVMTYLLLFYRNGLANTKKTGQLMKKSYLQLYKP